MSTIFNRDIDHYVHRGQTIDIWLQVHPIPVLVPYNHDNKTVMKYVVLQHGTEASVADY